jgi:hypothetical protein
MLILSYIPLVDGVRLYHHLRQHTHDPAALRQALLDSQVVNTKIHYILWCLHEGQPVALLGISRAAEVAAHMRAWSGDDVPGRFQVSVQRQGDGYEFMLWPQIDRDIKDEQVRYLDEHQEFLVGAEYSVLFTPFDATLASSAGFDMVAPLLGDKLTVGLIDGDQVRDHPAWEDALAFFPGLPVVPFRDPQQEVDHASRKAA